MAYLGARFRSKTNIEVHYKQSHLTVIYVMATMLVKMEYKARSFC